MHLKVGELARATGLTVRTLHHYDALGLLKPSARSEAGYRMYAQADVARLHAIQALRYLGLPLADIGPLLEGGEASVEAILQQQMQALQQQIQQATELQERLALLRDGLLRGKQPTVDDWVRSLSLMSTYGKYFSASEIRFILRGWGGIEPDWLALMHEVRAAMDARLAIDTHAVQALAWRWMALMHRWMDGDMKLVERWGLMYRQEPGARGQRGAPPADMIDFMESAIALRVQLLHAHVGDAFQRVRPVPPAAWAAIQTQGELLLAQACAPTSRPARALARRWSRLLDQSAGGDAALKAQLLTLHRGHPLLLAGSPISRAVREFLHQALDPHAT